MKKFIGTFMAAVLAALMSFSVFACTKPNEVDGITERIDESRTQIYVFNYNGGFGSEWLVSLKERFEKLHADDIYEEGRKGVQVIIHNQKTAASALVDQIENNRDEIYFTENAFYYTLLPHLEDITDAVTGDLTAYGDDNGVNTVENKLSDSQKDYFGVRESDGVHYYGLPHYMAYFGITYNVELFDKYNYYFAMNPTAPSGAGRFTSRNNPTKSVGVDGIQGTADDGLPTTYDEFFELCDYIAGDNNTPVEWAGAQYGGYLTYMFNALIADHEGEEQMMLNYKLEGTANDLGTVVNGNFVRDPQPTQITAKDGAELARQEGKYQALKFMNKLVTTEKYHNDLAFNSGHSHMDAQDDFLLGGNDGVVAPVGMLMDGVWWENEASATFENMALTQSENFSRVNRRFAVMPLPKANETKLAEARARDKSQTLIDNMYSMCFMKKGVAAWKKPLLIDFLKFAHTDESLVEYSRITGTPKALKYTMTEEQTNGMSPLGKSVMETVKNSDIVYPVSNNEFYLNNASRFFSTNYSGSLIGGTSYQYPSRAFHDGKVSAESYFLGMYGYQKSLQWPKN